jgi:plastocyanin
MIYMASECKLLYHPLTIRAINPYSGHTFKNLDSKGNPMHKKLFFGLLLFSLMTVILAGCGIVDVATTPSGTSTPGAQTTATTGGGGGGGASQHFGAPIDMTSQKAVTINIVLPPSGATCTPACFSPQSIKVKVGTAITWINKSNTPHTATAIVGEDPSSQTPDPKIFDSGVSSLIAPGQSYKYTVTPAAYNAHPDHAVVYYCQIHPVMTGAIFITQ